VSDPLPLASFQLDGDTRILIQTTPAPTPADYRPRPSGDGDEPAGIQDELKKRLASTLDAVRPAAATVLASLRDLNNPAGVELEFGIGINAEMDAFIASSTADVSFKVKLTWQNPGPWPHAEPR